MEACGKNNRYIFWNEDMKSGKLWIYRILTAIMPETRFFGLKAALLRWCGAKVGRNVRICSSARFLGVGELAIGDDVWVGPLTMIEASGNALVSIGDNVDIANGVMITTGTHEIDVSGQHIAGRGCNKPVEIGSGAWICMCAKLLPGSKVGEHSVVAAGSVVTKKFTDDYVLLADVPARIAKHY